MTSKPLLDRRGFLTRSAAAGSALILGGCDSLSQSPTFREMLYSAERATKSLQRLVLGERSLAREYSVAELSKSFKANGSTNPKDADYLAHVASSFADWRLEIDGLVDGRRSYPSTSCAGCRRGRRSRGTIASKAGVRSGNGPEFSSGRSCRALASSPTRAMPCFIARTRSASASGTTRASI